MIGHGVECFHFFWSEFRETFDNYLEIENCQKSPEKVFKKFFPAFKHVLEQIYDEKINEGTTSPFSFVRSKEIAEKMKIETNRTYRTFRLLADAENLIEK